MTSYTNDDTMTEIFTGTTDGAGDVTFTLTYSNLAREATFVYNIDKSTNLRPVVTSSGAGTSLTMRIYKTMYDKPDDTDTDANNLPAGVTAQSAKQNTDTTTSTVVDTAGGPVTSSTHTHGVSFQYEHTHVVNSYTTTDVGWTAAATQAITVIVIYPATLT